MVNEVFNANRTMVTIYDLDGNTHEATQLNARELVAGGSFSWNAKGPDVVDSPEEAPEEVEPAVTETPEEHKPIDTAEDWLADISERTLGSRDITEYLGQMTVPQLRDLAEMRYNVKLHHRTSAPKAVERIVELENTKIEEAEKTDSSDEE